jgi:hypothetical protein
LGGLRVTTTDATDTEIQTITIPDSSCYYIEATVTGCKSDLSARSAFKISGLFYRSGGSAIQQDSTVELVKIESNSSTNCGFSLSGNDVILEVTGIAAETWHWDSYIDVQRVSN